MVNLRGKPKDEGDDFEVGSRLWEAGKLDSAFEKFLGCARTGDPSCQLLVGYFYDVGIGRRRNRSLALRWYRRAHRAGDQGAAANNIGIILLEQSKARQALQWFDRALKRGNVGAAIHIGEYYLHRKSDFRKAAGYFRFVVKKADVEAEATVDKARDLLAESARARRTVGRSRTRENSPAR